MRHTYLWLNIFFFLSSIQKLYKQRNLKNNALYRKAWFPHLSICKMYLWGTEFTETLKLVLCGLEGGKWLDPPCWCTYTVHVVHQYELRSGRLLAPSVPQCTTLLCILSLSISRSFSIYNHTLQTGQCWIGPAVGRYLAYNRKPFLISNNRAWKQTWLSECKNSTFFWL